jgi:DNA polymerase-3 subunit alpha
MLMHTIFCCVCAKVKTNDTNRSWSWLSAGLPNQEYYFKTGRRWKKLFTDLPEAIWNLAEIVEIEIYNLAREVLLTQIWYSRGVFVVEDTVDGGVRGENAYLRHLTYEGAIEDILN